ncbi:MAG: 3-oxoadipate enol-lactonase [bacterium]
MNGQLQRILLANIEFTDISPKTNSGTLETLICLHGIGGNDASFLPQSIALSDQFRIIAWNMPGYAGSQSLEMQTFETLSESLHNLLQSLNVGPVHLVGQSIGGMIAQEFAHRHSELVKSLVLIATTSAFGGRDESFKQAFLQARLKPLDEGKSMAELATETVPIITGSKVTETVSNAAIKSMSAVPINTYRQILKCLITFNRREEFANIQCPVCLIAGSEDTNAPAITMKKMSDKLPDSEYHELQGGGHLVNIEMSDHSNRIICQFINKYFSDD